MAAVAVVFVLYIVKRAYRQLYLNHYHTAYRQPYFSCSEIMYKPWPVVGAAPDNVFGAFSRSRRSGKCSSRSPRTPPLPLFLEPCCIYFFGGVFGGIDSNRKGRIGCTYSMLPCTPRTQRPWRAVARQLFSIWISRSFAILKKCNSQLPMGATCSVKYTLQRAYVT